MQKLFVDHSKTAICLPDLYDGQDLTKQWMALLLDGQGRPNASWRASKGLSLSVVARELLVGCIYRSNQHRTRCHEFRRGRKSLPDRLYPHIQSDSTVGLLLDRTVLIRRPALSSGTMAGPRSGTSLSKEDSFVERVIFSADHLSMLAPENRHASSCAQSSRAIGRRTRPSVRGHTRGQSAVEILSTLAAEKAVSLLREAQIHERTRRRINLGHNVAGRTVQSIRAPLMPSLKPMRTYQDSLSSLFLAFVRNADVRTDVLKWIGDCLMENRGR